MAQSQNTRADKSVPWSGQDTFIWYVDGGELDGTYYRQYCPDFVDDYEGEVVIWYWDD